ncbi:penicillin-binding protein 1A [Candidatus Kinetoplastidibacterium galati]|uniref:peptidoglycan glycosyltransferase n=1 Tax=Candidatus Kinetoplastidibacterium galati TCC219 TaxID=1208921 RepID=M1LZA9_9PROT|nr:PBP1A family penicillin-binding protein [Candidatus Kinetoplastibacterium galatii]AGF49401.1 penicillin-binding protein 1A [Candidatus Kinetoplastibacterium galatii TCC219]
MKQKYILPKFLINIITISLSILAIIIFVICILISLTWRKLPDLSAMIDYKPRIPLRIYSSDNILIGEFGEERRSVLNFQDIPNIMKLSILAAEDDRFYKHGGIDWIGIVRAGLINLKNMSKTQGASTITMQLARNFYLSSEKTYSRKLYELMLTLKIESELTKNKILELYMNQIYLGNRAYGFAAASLVYFNKPLSEINLAESAMLAGIPKAPSIFNPISNFKRTKLRQNYVLKRMISLGYITMNEYREAIDTDVKIYNAFKKQHVYEVHGEYVAELVRQLLFKNFKSDLYSKGINVYTTIRSKDQDSAYKAVRKVVIDYTKTKYLGPEDQIEIPIELDISSILSGNRITEIFDKYNDSDEISAALVISANDEYITAIKKDKVIVKINKANSNINNNELSKEIKRGSIIHLYKDKEELRIINMPTLQAAFVSISPQDGRILSLVGGFDFYRGNFNRVTQAWRQPGSSIKPFIYASAIEKGISPATRISDLPLIMTAEQTGSKAWNPKNYGHRYEKDMVSMRNGLYKSKNMVSIRILQNIGPEYARNYLEKFGFDKSRQPAVISLALGTGLVTPLQLTSAFSIFANEGHLIPPYLIEKVTDSYGRTIMQHNKIRPNKSNQAIDSRVAYIMNDILRGVVKHGTASKAKKALRRDDIAGKTGTTNDSVDAWFSGYTKDIVATAWVGFDQPKSLGSNETGSNIAMPVWINYMKDVIRNYPEQEEKKVPEGIIVYNNELYLKEFPPEIAISEIKPSEEFYDEELRNVIQNRFEN